MDALVVYYSRTGNTRRLAETIARAREAVTEELIDEQDRTGVKGYFGAGTDAMFKREAAIGEPAKNPREYDLVIVGTPVWAFNMTPAVRTFLTRYGSDIKSIAFFCTVGGTGVKRTFQEMESLYGSAPLARVSANDRQMKNNKLEDLVDPFVADLRSAFAGQTAGGNTE